MIDSALMMAQSTHDDRRRDCRHPLLVRGIAEDVERGGTEFFDVVASDISERGVQLHTDREELFIPYGLLSLVFMPSGDGEPIQLKVQIAWMRRHLDPASEWSIGCTFVMTPLEHIHLLVDRARSAEARGDISSLPSVGA